MNQLLTFILSGTLLFCTLLGFSFLLLQMQQQQQSRRQLQIDGLIKLNVMRKLLTRMQQHRGLSNGILHGEEDLKPRLIAVTEKVNQLNIEIADMYPDLSDNERWQAMRDHWQRLAADYFNLNIRNNLEQHNKLVLNLLYLINDIAFDNKLHQLNNNNSESIQFLWQELLFTAESIAKIRAIGTGIAAAKVCTRAERIRLSYLCQSLEQSINIQKNPDYLLKISYLLKVIDTEIMISRPTIKADRFFNIATESIDMILISFDKQLNSVEQQLYTSTSINKHPA
ncbi:nitrate- and nitrite sensing domain-containing protein [Moritella sp. F3]|uniref:nitrate- and nitrite sensing domain-containing protein n=1 Tax=Moritella sp. F3 TaxID=2718882 RepID=UPI0018E1172C|nr:nitrate- and nitrite sensing domain-containing protein [Moritella sp. F3]GIC76538.1 hypothetical protein FMO001_12650 [Moritella sp. F1]GIC81709.1 hypothetical protein FMO003_19900 [Moritella sp. F3]